MADIKITINNKDRIIVIPMNYDVNSDSLEFSEVQIEPEIKKDEDVSKDIIVNLAHAIISMLRNMSN